MARFSLRPILRRLSSKHSTAAESTRSDGSDNSTVATSASPSPSPRLRSRSSQRGPRKSSSFAKLKDKFREAADSPAALPQESRASSVSVILEDQEAASLSQDSFSGRRELQQTEDEEEEQLEKTSLSQTLDDSSDARPAQQGQEPTTPSPQLRLGGVEDVQANPQLTLEAPTPEAHSGFERSG